ncbi:MAG: hypothetical protein HYX32_10670 [Actinobacteria bacterium]|nr:hypothetical protein [Actinomycetota bacterium]
MISSIGAGLSIVRAERERTASATDASIIDQLAAEVEDEVATAGASPSSIEVRVDEQSEKGTVRAVATGAVALASGALPGREPIDGEQARRLVEQHGAMVASLARIASFWVATAPGGKAREAPRVVVLDRWGDPVIDTSGDVLHDAEKPSLEAAVARHTRQRGPVKIEPTVWVLKGNRVTAIESGDRASTAADLAQTSAVSVPPAENDHTFVVIIGSK